MAGRHGLWERQRCVVNLRAGEVRVSHESDIARAVLANRGRYEGQGRAVSGDRGDRAVSWAFGRASLCREIEGNEERVRSRGLGSACCSRLAESIEMGQCWSPYIGASCARPISAVLLVLPVLPVLPVIPVMPVMPALPVIQVMPVMPALPVMPVIPVMPALPVMPVMPVFSARSGLITTAGQ